MGVRYGSFVVMYTAFSVGGLAWRINDASAKVLDFVDEKPIGPAEATAETTRVLESLLQSSFTIALLANLLLNFFVVVSLCMKAIFFGTLTLLETQKVVERMINYVIFKGLFLTWVVQPEMMQVALWLAWFAVLGFLKMFQGLARDRLDRLNASPSATIISHLRVFSVLLLVFFSDLFWIQLCLLVFKDTGISTFMLLLFEPLSIAFETLQAVLVHGIQLLDTWQRYSLEVSSNVDGREPSDRSAAGAAWERRGMIIRNCSFAMDLVSLLLALGHCLHIWWLRGLAFQVVDAVLFLNLRALLSAILKRIKGYMRIQTAMSTLQGALPDATQEELLGYDDECAICKEPMARAKRLPCAHLFHLSCLRSWLDQGIAETYSCPTCRRPLFMGTSRSAEPGEGLLTSGVTQSSFTQFPTDQQQNTSSWRDSGTDTDWMGDGQSSEASSRGLSRIERLMRHLSGTGGGHQAAARQQSSEVNARGLARIELMMRQISTRQQSSQRPSSPSRSWWLFSSRHRQRVNINDDDSPRSVALSGNGNAQLMAMVSTVREVLPHVSDEVIVQDLRRTNCAIATVNNLL